MPSVCHPPWKRAGSSVLGASPASAASDGQATPGFPQTGWVGAAVCRLPRGCLRATALGLSPAGRRIPVREEGWEPPVSAAAAAAVVLTGSELGTARVEI